MLTLNMLVSMTTRHLSPLMKTMCVCVCYLLQVHVLGQLLLQHVLQLLVHLSQILVSWFHQISEDGTQTSSFSLRASVTSDRSARHI